MKKFKENKIINLDPGEFHWGNKGDVISTLLGSCVAICIWHPEMLMGGMSHIMLQGRRMSQRKVYNLHYSDDVIWFLIDKIHYLNTSPEDYVVKLFGGSNMFNSKGKTIGDVLVENILNRLHYNGFHIDSKNIGGNFARKLFFEISTGDIWLKKYDDEIF